MNDRFKFRVWDKVFNKYWTDEEIKENAAWLLFPDNSNIDDIEIEQCTSSKDKNGKLIFEGDILDNDFLVVWKYLGWCFKAVHVRDSIPMPFSSDMTEFEVTGNIHENPELLK